MENLKKRIVEEAKKYIGVPYVWGGKTPSGFDCSGLVQYVYRQVGIDMPRITYKQYQIGVQVINNCFDIGDLIFFKGISNSIICPSLVGIYIGDDKYITASKTGDFVKIFKVSDKDDILGVKRIINSDNNIILSCTNFENAYIGDIKYSLYKYIVKMNAENINIRCGKFAYYKLSNLAGFSAGSKKNIFGILNLNGEIIKIYCVPDLLNKKELIISSQAKYVINKKEQEVIMDGTIYNNDIVLEIA